MAARPGRPAPALSAACYTLTQRWQLDSLEYADSLPEAAREWLATFLLEYYHGRRMGLQPLEQQRASDRARVANARDVMTRVDAFARRRRLTEDVEIGLLDRSVAMPSLEVEQQGHDTEEEKLIERIDEREAEAVLTRIRAFRRGGGR